MSRKQYLLVEITISREEMPCGWSSHAKDIKAALMDHGDVKSVKVLHYKPESKVQK